MTPARLQTVEEIFHAALDQEPDRVRAFLDTACEGDEVLRRKVEALVASHQRAGSFIETTVAGITTRIIENEQADLLVGRTIGHYKISKRIGTGGMGDVYLATDMTAGRKAALKLLPTRFTSDAERLKRFQQEARALVGLNHPNIVTVYEIGEDHSTHYIASELIEGETLRQRLVRGRMELSEAIDVAIQVASALAAADETGIVHRDIKPENIMLRPDGYVKVLDFGIAKLAESAFAEATADGAGSMTLAETNLGSILGTVRYMSPEQAYGVPVDKRTDIWSLGVVLYEMVTGHAPFTGDTPSEVMASILEKEPPPLTSYITQTPAELQQIISKTLRKEREERYQSAHQLLEALQSLRRSMEFKTALERSTKAPLWLRWTRSPTALVLLLLVAAFAVALPFYWHRNPATSLPPEKSIAVLPLENLSEEKENAFFATGIQDELLSNLSKIADLKVISRTSVMQYKSGTRRNLKEIAQQLGVSNVVEGSVRRSGDHVRVSVQLVDTRTDRHLWAENYDRKVADSVSLQGELATEIAAAVGATLTPQEKARVEAKPTSNPAAYDAYLRARAIPVDWGFALKGDIESAVHLYEQAVKLDPNFTLAWAYLSIAQIQSVEKGFEPSAARLAAAKDSLDHALALGPNLPEVHLARGYQEQDDTRALAEFRQAENGLPNSADVIEAIARVQRALGHWDEAVANLRRAIELDPRNIRASNNLALTYCAMRRFPEAVATLDRVLAWDPTNARALLTKADALMAIGDLHAAEPLLANPEVPVDRRARYALFQRNYAAAIEILSKDLAVEREQRDPVDILLLAFSQRLAGDVAAARATYQKAIESFRRELQKVEPDSGFDPYTRVLFGAAYAGLGEAASAIAEGKKAIGLLPSSKNPEFGPRLEDEMARIYAQLVDADHAIPMLKRLLRTQFAGANLLTPATLRLDPIWDPIRNDPRFQELTAETAPLPEKSIAVLPFENLSKDEENAFFAGGVQDEILTDLAKIADLKVISRTSVMQYKSGPERNLREIAKALGVSHVVEGSVQRAGGRVRVSAQLIDARTDAHLWAETYDRDVADVFAIQSEIAQAIANQLQAKLSPAEKSAIEERPTKDLAAYDLYRRAYVLYWGAWSNGAYAEASFFEAASLLNQAITRDPEFFLAYCDLARTHSALYFTGKDHTPSRLALAEAAIAAAARLRPNSGELHLLLAEHLYHAYLDYDHARAELALAQRTLPNNGQIFYWMSLIDRRQGRWNESVRNFEKAMELDPHQTVYLRNTAQIYELQRRFAEAAALLDRVLKLMPQDPGAGEFDKREVRVVRASIDLAWRADPRPLHVAIEAIVTENPAAATEFPYQWFNLALCEHDPVAADRALAAMKPGGLGSGNGESFPRAWFEGLAAHARGDAAAARAAFASARVEAGATVREQPDYGPNLCVLGMIDAALGRKEDAIREGRRAVELLPVAKDSLAGAGIMEYLAIIYAWTGEKTLAIDQVAATLQIPSSLNYGKLRLHPFWDPLRGDPRFEKLVASLAPK